MEVPDLGLGIVRHASLEGLRGLARRHGAAVAARGATSTQLHTATLRRYSRKDGLGCRVMTSLGRTKSALEVEVLTGIRGSTEELRISKDFS